MAEIRPALGTSVVSLYNLFPAATINGMPAPGYSSGQALDAMEKIAQRALPRCDRVGQDLDAGLGALLG